MTSCCDQVFVLGICSFIAFCLVLHFGQSHMVFCKNSLSLTYESVETTKCMENAGYMLVV